MYFRAEKVLSMATVSTTVTHIEIATSWGGEDVNLATLKKSPSKMQVEASYECRDEACLREQDYAVPILMAPLKKEGRRKTSAC